MQREREGQTGKPLDGCDGIQHIGIPTAELKKTCEFYEELGFERTFETVIGDGQHVAFLNFQNVTLELYEGEPAGKAGAVDHISINCLDVQKAYALAVEKGYPVVSNGIEELPFWKNGVRFFTIEGPNREKIELNQYL